MNELSQEKAETLTEREFMRLVTLGQEARAEAIKTEHLLYEQSIKKGLAHAMRAGELLLEVKRSIEHGQFSEWVLNNCSFSLRTAQNYMRFYTQRKVLAKAQETALLTEGELTMEQALKFLKAKDLREIRRRITEQNKRIYNTPEMVEAKTKAYFSKHDKAVQEYLNNVKSFMTEVETAQKALDFGKFSSEAVKFTLRRNTELIEKLSEFNNELKEVKL